MKSEQIRQSFLDFFEERSHTIVTSASLMPTAPNLLFTNAGMNPFVPYFLGERSAPYPRAADTQKCIRAGGKHNDLDDVGKDAYHHTFFEMLGNWSFGDYFKPEAIEWAWELITGVWGFPKERLYATVYKPGEGDPADFDQEAYDFWKAIFEKEGLDPEVHIRTGNKKDNFWMMGETGPCGPCSELHIDLTPDGGHGELVNADSPWCIEIWNLVFIQFNAGEDGSFVPLKDKHVDTGMGFERVAGILATTKNFTDYSKPPSNYESDLFTDLFDFIGGLCGKSYSSTLQEDPTQTPTAEEEKDIVFRVLADHIRTLSFSIADGILPGNEGRNYVLRRILRRAVMYGRRLELPEGFFTKLVDPLVDKMGGFFPELKEQQTVIRKVIQSEEQAFERTLDRGLQEFEKIADNIEKNRRLYEENLVIEGTRAPKMPVFNAVIGGGEAFKLYDTYGFPLDLTELLAAERGYSVDTEGFETAMEAQRERARKAQKKEVISVSEGDEAVDATEFVGYERANEANFETELTELTESEGRAFAVLKASPFYAEMGGQVGDTGKLLANGEEVEVVNTIKDASGRFLHELSSNIQKESSLALSLDIPRRRAIERHHTGTHILHWALREVLGKHVRQAGSYVGPDRLRFDFAHFEQVTPQQLLDIEKLCNERIVENGLVNWQEVLFDEKPENTIAFFGEKYGDVVRVVDIGGSANELGSGYSVELCGGTHVEATGEIGLLKLVSESAVAAGTRRIEAVAGNVAYDFASANATTLHSLAGKLSCKPNEVEDRFAALLEQRAELEKELKQFKQKQSAGAAGDLAGNAKDIGNGLKLVAAKVDAENPNALRGLAVQLGKQLGEGIVVLGGAFGEKCTVLALCSDDAIADGHKAGDIVRKLTAELDGKGGGKPDFAMGGGTQPGKLEEVLKAFAEKF